MQVKVYKKKLKRHNDQVMQIYSPKGIEGGILVSGSADHEIRSKQISVISLCQIGTWSRRRSLARSMYNVLKRSSFSNTKTLMSPLSTFPRITYSTR